MVFVHARNSTVRTAMTLIEMAKNRGELSFFQAEQGADFGHCEKQVSNTVDLATDVKSFNLNETVNVYVKCASVSKKERSRLVHEMSTAVHFSTK